MLIIYRTIVFLCSILMISIVNAAPSKFVFDENVFRTQPSYKFLREDIKRKLKRVIFAAYQEIPHDLAPRQLRFAILDAAISNLSIKWLLEEEGEDYMLFRWDYRGNSIITRVEFNESLIQLKYEYVYGEFVCKNNVSGICYDNDNIGYYLHVQRLRTSIIKSVETYQGA